MLTPWRVTGGRYPALMMNAPHFARTWGQGGEARGDRVARDEHQDMQVRDASRSARE